jgi:endonuclease/exonuclease/phosphatase family metal-dependent hydrolase
VASFNVHAGVDRHGAPFDVDAAVDAIDADVLVVQELWWADGAPAPAARLAERVGGWWVWQAAGRGTFIANGRGRLPGLGASAVILDDSPSRAAGLLTGRADRVVGASSGTGPDRVVGASSGTGPDRVVGTASGAAQASDIVADGVDRHGGGGPGAGLGGTAVPSRRNRGAVGTAVVSRLPILRSSMVPLPPLRRDGVWRGVVVADVAVGATTVRIIGTHMAHLSHGARRHFAAIRHDLTPAPGARDGWVLAGDLNLWGSVVERVLPGWHRAVVGRTWPAHRPIVQPDHILVAGAGLRVRSGKVHHDVGSDHRPVSAVLDVRGAVSDGSAVVQDDCGLRAGVHEGH